MMKHAKVTSWVDRGKIRKAFEYAANAHDGMRRKSGEPYILHPLAVARVLAEEMELSDHVTIMCALLHDVVEDTEVTLDDIEREFGKKSRDIIDGLTKIKGAGAFDESISDQAENFRKILLTISEDIRVVLIKLADRLHNMRTLGSMSPQSRRRIARETLDIYAPIADRLGMNSMKHELEDMGFANLYPWRHQTITEHLDAMTGHREEIVANILDALKRKMNDLGVPCRITGRQKSPYSIYKKMLAKDLSFSEVTDFFAFRVITHTEQHCYLALG